mmetsp:Transcript_21036/g.67785  ORF Transcript_21036/g.67785 Transcript_21036/m.67785 type:complete len:1132 (-) Transcript_21036:50-3445(-)
MAQRRPYNTGMIRKVVMHNFLTYEDVEFSPGPRLNVIMGPNGTGKSSIVCAIALALGASPRILGRADNILEFVRTGKEEGFVEVELHDARKGKTRTVRREIFKKSKQQNKWFLDGRVANEAAVKAVVKDDFNIQIANLCTFLPQEKVGEFSAFDDVGLLKETEKALGGDALAERHEELVEVEKELATVERRKAGMAEVVENLEDQKRQLEPDKKKLEKRAEHLRKVDVCKTKILWLLFDEKREKAIAKKDAQADKQKDLDLKRTELEPLVRKEKKAQKEIDKFHTTFQSCSQKQQTDIESLATAQEKYEQAKDAVEDARTSLENSGTRRATAEANLKKQQASLKDVETQIRTWIRNEFPDDDSAASRSLEDVIQKAKTDASRLRPAATDAHFKAQEAADAAARAQSDLREPNEQLRRATQLVNDLKDVRSRRLNDIAKTRVGNQCVEMKKWIDANAGKFRYKVYGPCCLEVSAKEPEDRAVLEAHVGNWIWNSFVCSCKSDYDQCVRRTDKDDNFDQVNFLLAQGFQDEDMSQQQQQQQSQHRDREASYSAEFVKSHLEPFGVAGTLYDLCEAPAPVLKALDDFARLRSAVYGGEALRDALNDRQKSALEKNLMSIGGYVAFVVAKNRRGMIELTRFQGIRSRYQKQDVALVVNTLPQKTRSILGEPCDPKELAEAEESLQAATRRTEEATVEYQKLSAEVKKVKEVARKAKEELDRVMKEKDQFAAAAKNKRNAQTRVKQAEDKVDKADEDERRDKAKHTRALEAAVERTLKAFAEAVKLQRKVCDWNLEAAAGFVSRDVARHRKQRVSAELAERKKETKDLEVEVANLQEDFDAAKVAAKKAKLTAERDAPLTKPEIQKDQVLNDEYEALPETVDEVEQIQDTEDNEAKNIYDNPGVLQRYKALEKKLEEESQKVASMDKDLETHKSKLDDLKGPWETTLRTALAALKTKFAEYMGSLDARGDVDLFEGPTFDKWGLLIKVAFRDTAPLSKLEAHVQSGGERSVSTIMFLMALQAHMPSPFRVVDEINQGMDEVNERIVFKRVVANSTGPDAPQYFLITPKLLANLEGIDHPDVTCCVVFNGAYNLKRKFDLDAFLQAAKKKRIKPAAAGAGGGNDDMDDDDDDDDDDS